MVGAGSSGVQIADELVRAGRRVYLSVGPHDRPPRSYRGRDFVWWPRRPRQVGRRGPARWARSTSTIAVSGADGGHTIDFRQLAASGITLVGRTEACENGVMHFAADLKTNIERGDANYLLVLDEADAFVARNGIALPDEPGARHPRPMPDCVTSPALRLDLAQAGIGSIIWATGYDADYSWLKVDALDKKGRPRHQRGVSSEPGIYFLGLPWQSRRGSSFIWGVWHDAKYIADHIHRQRGYLAYAPAALSCREPVRCRRLRKVNTVNLPTHTRIRPFNTKDTYPEQNLDNDLCQAVVANGVVYLRGQIGQDLETRESVGIGDVEAQAEKAMANIDLLLREAGSGVADIVKVIVYLTDIRYREPVYRVMGRWLKGVYPVSTGLVVEALARPEWLVEIDATAVISAAS